MPETNETAQIVPPGSTPNPPASPVDPATPKRRGRLWLKILIGVIVAIVLLVLLAPTIAGTAPVRSLVLSKVNENLNGKVTVEDWSVGWRSGLTVTGVRVVDANDIQVLQVSKVTSDLTLLDAIRGKFNLGETTVDGFDALVKSDAQGNLNFESLAKKPTPAAEPPAAPSATPKSAPDDAKPPKPAEPSKLPDVSGNIKLVNCKITYEDGRSAAIGGSGQTFYFPSIAGSFKIPSINEPIDNSLDLAFGRNGEGKISTKGTISVVKNNSVDVESANVNQTLTLRQIQAEGLTFLFGKDSSIRKLAGMTNADVSVQAQPGQDAVITAQITSTNFAIGGPVLKGDTLSTKSLIVSVPNVTVVRSASPNDMSKWSVKAGTEAQPLAIKLDQGTATAFADATVGGLQNFAAGLAPGSAGRIRSDVNFDIGALGKELRATFGMKPGSELKSGTFSQSLNVALAADRATVEKFTIDLTDVVAKQADGSDFAPKPIHLNLAASSFGGGWSSPDLRDLDLNLTSGFATATAKAKRLSDDLAAQLSADLKKFQSEWDPIVDFGDLNLSGTVTASANTLGDVVAGKDTKIDANLTLAGIGLSRAESATPDNPKPAAKAILADYSGAMKLDGAYKPADPAGAQIAISSLTYKDDGKLLDVTSKGSLLLSTGQGPQSRATTSIEKPLALEVTIGLPNLLALQNLANGFSADAPLKAAIEAPLREQFAAAAPVGPPTTEPAEAPAPPMMLDAGSATIDLKIVSQDGARRVVTSHFATQGLAIHKGNAKRLLDKVDLQTETSFVVAAPVAPSLGNPPESASALQQMRDVVVAKLDLNAGPAARLFITEPIKVGNPADVIALVASLSDPKATQSGAASVRELAATLHLTGNLGELMGLMKVLQADATPGRPYEGNYSFDQKLSAGEAGIAINGLGNVDDLKNADGTFSEKRLHLANDLVLNQAKQALNIKGLVIDTESTKALQVTLRGDVLDLSTQRRLNLSGNLAADWAKAWDLVRPMMSPETQKSLNLTIAGKQEKPFSLTGSYPAGKPFNEAVRTLVGSFGLNIDLLDIEGLKVERLDLPGSLKDGHFRIAYADKPQDQNIPAAADCNGGKVLLGGADVDMTGPVMRLSLPANHKLLENVGLNKILSDRLGDFINNPLFVDPDEAAGTLSVTFANCDRLALASPTDPAAKEGRAMINIAVSTLQLGNPMLKQIADELNQEDIFKSLRGEMTKESSIRIENGKTYQDITILTAEHKRPFRITGDTDLATSRLHLTFLLPSDLLGSKLERFFPDGLPVALAGTTRGVQVDVAGQIQSIVQKNLVPGLLESLTGGAKKPGATDDPGAKPAIPTKAEDFLGLLGNPTKDPEKEKAKKERYEQRRKAREAAAATQPAGTDPDDDAATVKKPDKKKKK